MSICICLTPYNRFPLSGPDFSQSRSGEFAASLLLYSAVMYCRTVYFRTTSSAATKSQSWFILRYEKLPYIKFRVKISQCGRETYSLFLEQCVTNSQEMTTKCRCKFVLISSLSDQYNICQGPVFSRYFQEISTRLRCF